jgi:hypothetical protein
LAAAAEVAASNNPAAVVLLAAVVAAAALFLRVRPLSPWRQHISEMSPHWLHYPCSNDYQWYANYSN